MIPFVDLKQQYYNIKHEVDNAIFAVINNSAFIKVVNNTAVDPFQWTQKSFSA